MRCSQRDQSVTEQVELLTQFGGTPMSASTNRGLRSALGGPLCPPVGVVGSWREAACPARVRPCVVPCDGAFFVVRFSLIDARGVGHIFDMTVSDVTAVRLPPILVFIARCASGDF